MITASLCLLCACGRGDRNLQRAMDFRAELLEAGGCTYTAELTADYGDRIYSFTVLCSCSSSGTELTVMAPETIRGISAFVTAEDAEVRFDETALDFGSLDSGNVAPISAPELLYNCWTSEYIDTVGIDGDQLQVTYLQGYDESQLTVYTWLDETGAPTRGEILCGDRVVLTAQITEFSDS